MPDVGWSPGSLRAALAYLFLVTAVCLSASGEALSFDSKKLESSSQIWTGYHPSANTLFTSFEDFVPQNITALVGESAYLPCIVYHLGDRSVTWMRKRDLHILTAGVYTYSADERFMVIHPENSNDWTLHIRFVTLRDAGVYECQVNSDPKISRKVILNVIESQLDDPDPNELAVTDTLPVVMIDGPQERHIQKGSILAITCVVRHPPQEAPEHILWFHGTTNIDYDSPRGGVSIQTEKSLRKTVSKLMLSAVNQSDTGAYSCSPTALQPAEVTVHVQNGQIQQPVKQGLGFNKAPRIAVSSASFVLVAILTHICKAKWDLFG